MRNWLFEHLTLKNPAFVQVSINTGKLGENENRNSWQIWKIPL
jgi:hypothetical protein